MARFLFFSAIFPPVAIEAFCTRRASLERHLRKAVDDGDTLRGAGKASFRGSEAVCNGSGLGRFEGRPSMARATKGSLYDLLGGASPEIAAQMAQLAARAKHEARAIVCDR